jgi:leucyl-tRNA synthetase
MTNKENIVPDDQETLETKKRVHIFLRDYQDRLSHFKPNTAISAMMEFINDANAQNLKIGKSSAQAILTSISVLAPHIASELLWNLFGKPLKDCPWPRYNPTLTTQNQVTIVVQINGKVRANIKAKRDEAEHVLQPAAKQAVKKWLDGKEVAKVIFVKNKLINFVIR